MKLNTPLVNIPLIDISVATKVCHTFDTFFKKNAYTFLKNDLEPEILPDM